MNIKIWDDKYLIKSDAYCYTLAELKEKIEKKGDDNIYENVIGYYSNIEYLFQALIAREGRLNKCTTLEGYVKHIEKINEKLEENLLAMAAVIGNKESFKRIMIAMPDQIPDSIAKLGEAKKAKKGSSK